jgi:hypothetical protein
MVEPVLILLCSSLDFKAHFVTQVNKMTKSKSHAMNSGLEKKGNDGKDLKGKVK